MTVEHLIGTVLGFILGALFMTWMGAEDARKLLGLPESFPKRKGEWKPSAEIIRKVKAQIAQRKYDEEHGTGERDCSHCHGKGYVETPLGFARLTCSCVQKPMTIDPADVAHLEVSVTTFDEEDPEGRGPFVTDRLPTGVRACGRPTLTLDQSRRAAARANAIFDRRELGPLEPGGEDEIEAWRRLL